MKHQFDYITVECDLSELKTFVEQQEKKYDIAITKAPSICLTMIRAQDTVESQEFYTGEVLTTDCEVAINGNTGYGICIGDEDVRSYCIAVIDAILQTEPENEEVNDFLKVQYATIEQRKKEEYNQILRTRVDFKMMEQA
jgi:alpha-D-ribose 1-methylphosphonate 5-triphosphate synthase subunit PhnG